MKNGDDTKHDDDIDADFDLQEFSYEERQKICRFVFWLWFGPVMFFTAMFLAFKIADLLR